MRRMTSDERQFIIIFSLWCFLFRFTFCCCCYCSYHNRMGEIVHSAMFTEICLAPFLLALSSRFFPISSLFSLSEYLDIIWNDHIAKTKSFWNGNPKNLCTQQIHSYELQLFYYSFCMQKWFSHLLDETDFVLEKLGWRQKNANSNTKRNNSQICYIVNTITVLQLAKREKNEVNTFLQNAKDRKKIVEPFEWLMMYIFGVRF